MRFTTAAVSLALIASASAFAPTHQGKQMSTVPKLNMAASSPLEQVGRAMLAGVLAFGLATVEVPKQANAMTMADREQLSYLQVKGTGLANRCSDVDGEGSIQVSNGQRLVDLCIEPKAFAIEEDFGGNSDKIDKKFVPAKVMTRQTYTLDAIEGPIAIENGKLVFYEKEGLDYSPITLKSPMRGEGNPMLFNVKQLVAKGDGTIIKPGYMLTGDFKTPSYRTGLFQDPKGRGGTTGYDMAVALPALQSGIEGDDRLYAENNKVFDESIGHIEMQVSQVDADTNEIGGVFVSLQKGDSDMGAHEAKNILIKGIFYGRLQ
jgi:photosystem II oxygen-evolving enhancer protein 1